PPRRATIIACVFASLPSSGSSAALSAGPTPIQASDGARCSPETTRGRHSKLRRRPFVFGENEVSVRVAYQGEPGAFSEAAVLRLVPDAEPRPYPTFDEVFDAVSDGSVNLGVVPSEDSIGGSPY